MPSWYLKASIQGVISLLPFSNRLNYLFQRYITRGLRLTDSYFKLKLITCAQHLANYDRFRQGIPQRVVELGTGRLPIIPIGLYLCGVEDIITIDVNPLLREQPVLETLQYFVKFADTGRLMEILPGVQPQRLETLRTVLKNSARSDVEKTLKALSITRIVGDARAVTLQDVDLMLSNNTLEHVPGDVIEGIFSNFHSILNQQGLMSHLIDLTDHYSHFDHSLTPYNFLQYSEATWRFFNNHLHYQNRMRVSDYRQIHTRSGYTLLDERNEPQSTDQIDTITLAPAFQHYTHDDLIVTRSWMVSCPI